MAVAATGFFDGVHAGHRAVLNLLMDTAKTCGEESAVITFWPHPRNVLQQDAGTFRLLNTLDEKRELILGLGVDHFHVIPFTKAFSELDTVSFMRQYLRDRYSVSTLVVGFDHRLGRGSVATRGDLAALATQVGISTKIVDEVGCADLKVSSTQIRNHLAAGDVRTAATLLGYDYSLHGVVVLGNRLGRSLGFPTANMALYEPLKMVPADGVYLVRVDVLGRQAYGICNVGTRPTVASGNARTIETHIFDFSEDIYGLDLRIHFLERIREERKFPSLESLRERMVLDSELARNFLENLGKKA